MKNIIWHVKDKIVQAFLFGLAGGVVGLLTNAVLIDVFEASKVAEPLWILLGIGVGAGYLYKTHPINYKSELLHIFTSRVMVLVYLLIIVLTVFVGSINNFFVADDFTWLRWAAEAKLQDIPSYFISAPDFFYRPIDKTIVYFLYQLFSFQPQGYHLFILFIHFLTVVGVYYLSKQLFKNKVLGFLTAVLFALHPVHHENIYWFSTLSVTISAFFMIYVVLSYMHFREKASKISYGIAILLSILALLTYEIAVIMPLLLMAVDIFIMKPKRNRKLFYEYLPFIILVPLYFAIRAFANAFSGGGDYSYNLLNLPFNVVGNYIGYIGLFLSGNSAIPVYAMLRDSLRNQPLLAAAILILVGIILCIIGFTFRKKLLRILKNQYIMIICFGMIFAAISLLPFLGLGNIAPRYFYLASVGFSLAFVALLQYIGSFTPKTIQKHLMVILIVLVTVISFCFYKEDQHMAQQWNTAGKITEHVLKFFRVDYESFSNKTQVYFVGAPLKYNDAWLFPVGLNDALWFIYRERQPKVYQVPTIGEAKAQIKAMQTKENFIFKFDKDGKIIREM
jgi:hypothetical protein